MPKKPGHSFTGMTQMACGSVQLDAPDLAHTSGASGATGGSGGNTRGGEAGQGPRLRTLARARDASQTDSYV
jgi:hypothetical protein